MARKDPYSKTNHGPNIETRIQQPRSLYVMRHGPNTIDRKFWSKKDVEVVMLAARQILTHLLVAYRQDSELEIHSTNTHRTCETARIVYETVRHGINTRFFDKEIGYSVISYDNFSDVLRQAEDSIIDPLKPVLIVGHNTSLAGLNRPGSPDYSLTSLAPAQAVHIVDNNPLEKIG